jgi:hypothetical protein
MTGPETWTTDQAKVQALADQLNADDDEFRYEVEPRGRYFGIAVFDDDGTKLGNL